MSLEQLLERVETASGPDREIDASIRRLDDPEFRLRGEGGVSAWRGVVCLGPSSRELPAYTSSIDAAVKLVEEKLPDCWWNVEREQHYDNGTLRPRYIGRVRKQGSSRLHVVASFATPALALLAAFLRAMIAEGQK